MGAQTSYTEQLAAYAGLRYGMDHNATTGVNDAGMDKQVHEVTVDAFTADATVSFVFTDSDGVDHLIEFVNPAAGDETDTRDGLIDALRAIQELEGAVTANPSGTAVIVLTAIEPGVGFTVGSLHADLSDAVVTANGTLESILFGRGVIRRSAGGDQSVTVPTALTDRAAFRGALEREHHIVDPLDPTSPAATPGSNLSIIERGGIWVPVTGAVSKGDRAYCVFTPAANRGKFRADPGGTAQVMRIAISGNTAGTMRFALNGRIFELIIVAQTVDQIVTELTAAANALDEPVTAVADLPNDRIDFTADNAGDAFSLVEISDAAGEAAISTVTANVAGVAFPVDAEFESTTTGAGLAKLKINRPQPGARAY
jgi:hypothetical protein